MARSNVEIVRAAYDAFGRGDTDAVFELCDPDIVVRDPERTGTTSRGTEGMRQFWAEWFENWQEYRVEPREFEEHGDQVLVRAEQSGRGKLSGVEIRQDLFNVLRLRDGKVVEYRLYTGRDAALASIDE
ncbi:MAG: nuclear transport factor 2 family protein [Actinobacteria bacterium]|nr:MAG: nuclear transport factor 2 family protein [Actinomycetota bacterium]